MPVEPPAPPRETRPPVSAPAVTTKIKLSAAATVLEPPGTEPAPAVSEAHEMIDDSKGEESWPSDEAETLARAEASERGESLQATPPPPEEEEPEKSALPDLNQLVERLPASLKETLEDLFRARWSRVARFKKRDLAG